MGWWNGEPTGPILYSVPNRTPVTCDVPSLVVCFVFVTLYVAFLIIFPGVRKEKLTTFTTVTLSLFVGNAIMVCKMGSSWHVARTKIHSSYSAFSKELVPAELGAYIGLAHINITLRGDNNSDIDFNERFTWRGSGEMGASYRAGLERGLPFPILRVAEYFTLGQEGFTWGGNYRHAGYYTAVFLWAAFACWLLSNLLLLVVPRYGAGALAITGGLMLSSAFTYHCLLPSSPLYVRFEERHLSFKFGWCFWLIVLSGALSVFTGLVILAIDFIYPNRFSTILEVDYDTPYDRHVIIEESHTKRRAGKGLEEPPGLGRRILRRLSSKKEETEEGGRSNAGFEMDVPKSPWNYPLHRPALPFRRQDSASSAASSIEPSAQGGRQPFQRCTSRL